MLTPKIRRKSTQRACKTCYIALSILAVLALSGIANAAEGGAFTYPIGAETVMPAFAPPPKLLLFQEFTEVYSAGQFNDSNGKSAIPGFRLTVFAGAQKFKYNWGTNFLGGKLMTGGGPTQVYEQVEAAGATGHNMNFGNTDLEPLFVVYHKGSLFWQYGMDIWTPGLTYNRTSMVNIGTHYWSFEPTAAFTYLPNKGQTEVSSRVHYGINTTNPDTKYHTGDDLAWEWDVMQNINKRVALGANGYVQHQTTDDELNGQKVGSDGFRSNVVGIGPEVRIWIGKSGIAFKYFKEVDVRNHPLGSCVWFEAAIPVHMFGVHQK